MTEREDMSIKVKISRYDPVDKRSYLQIFEYEVSGRVSVAKVLEDINLRDPLTDTAGDHAGRISWECSCLQGVCGACAMVIDGIPALACETFVTESTAEVMIEPLKKYPIVADLVVDRSIIERMLRENNIYIHEYRPSDKKEFEHRYQAAKCLKCGLCLEVCPNWNGEGRFGGALFANECYLTDSADNSNEVRRAYKEHFESGCSKSLSCAKVCPMQIETIASIAKMNRRKKR